MALTTRCASCTRLLKNPAPATCPHCRGAVAAVVVAKQTGDPLVLAHNRAIAREVFHEDLAARREARRRAASADEEAGGSTAVTVEQIREAKGKALAELIASVEDVTVLQAALEAETRKTARAALEARIEELTADEDTDPDDGPAVVFMLRRAGTDGEESEWFTSLEGDGETGDIGDGLAFKTEAEARAAVEGRKGIEVVRVQVEGADAGAGEE